MKTLAPKTPKPRDLTTGDLARLLKCAPRTVTKWADAGLIPGLYKLPVSADRRFTARGVVAFCRERGLPVPRELLPAAWGVYVGGFDPADAGAVTLSLAALQPDAPRRTGTMLDLAHAAGSECPVAAVLGPQEGLDAAARLAEILLVADPAPAVAVVLGDDLIPADHRLDAVRSRLAWVGRRPAGWGGLAVAVARKAGGS